MEHTHTKYVEIPFNANFRKLSTILPFRSLFFHFLFIFVQCRRMLVCHVVQITNCTLFYRFFSDFYRCSCEIYTISFVNCMFFLDSRLYGRFMSECDISCLLTRLNHIKTDLFEKKKKNHIPFSVFPHLIAAKRNEWRLKRKQKQKRTKSLKILTKFREIVPVYCHIFNITPNKWQSKWIYYQ